MRKNKILAILVFLLLLGAGIMVIWLPDFRKYLDLKQTLSTKELELSYKQDYFQKIAGIFNEAEKYKEQLEKIDLALPSDFYQSDFFDFLEKKSGQNGLALASISGEIKAEKSNSSIAEHTGNIVSSGDYNSLKSFLADLYNSAKLIEVSSIKFDASEKSGGIYEYNITVRTFSRAENPEK